MPRPPSLRVLWPLAALLVLAAATACSSSGPSAAPDRSPAAAIVGRTRISTATVLADLAAESDVPAATKTLEVGNPLLDPDPKVKGTYTAAAKAEALSARILHALYGRELATLGRTVTAADRKAVHDSLCVDPATGDVPPATSCPPLAKYPAAYRAFLLATQERVLAMGAVVYGAVYDRLVTGAPAKLDRTCFSSVHVPDSEASDALRAALATGRALSAAVNDISPSSTAGNIRRLCSFDVTLPAEVADAKVGDAVSITSDSAIYVVRIDSAGRSTKAQFVADPPVDDADVNTAVAARVQSLLGAVQVTVAKAYGTWDLGTLTVVPPAGSSPTTTAPSTTTTPAGGTGTTTTTP